MTKVNQDIREYMADRCVSQRDISKQMGISQYKVCMMLKSELSQNEKDNILNHIDAIVADRADADDVVTADINVEIEDEIEDVEEEISEEEGSDDVTVSTKFQIGDRVKIPSKHLTIGIISDIWHSLAQNNLMYAVDTEGGNRGLYSENQLEPAPLPIEYSWEAHIDGNVAVCIMNATQGDKTWIYARGHAHIIHDGEVGMAQAISYAARRMFESLDKKQDKKIYFKEG